MVWGWGSVLAEQNTGNRRNLLEIEKLFIVKVFSISYLTYFVLVSEAMHYIINLLCIAIISFVGYFFAFIMVKEWIYRSGKFSIGLGKVSGY